MSYRIKAASLAWLRFKRQFSYAATECGHYSSDILGSNGKKLYEIEAKTSKQDLINDFKKHKHQVYAVAEMKPKLIWIPNIMYFAVYEELVEYALEIVGRQDSRYGIIKVSRKHFVSTVIKQAKPLHNRVVSESVLTTIVRRMSSDLANTYMHGAHSIDLMERIKQMSEKTSPELFEWEDINEE